MTDEARLELISSTESPVVDVVFVHGLTGDAKKTWSTDTHDGFWPEWLASELNQTRVYSLGYPAGVLKKPMSKEMDLFERATNVLEQFANYEIGVRPIVFIAHSLGGLLMKMFLRKSIESSDRDWRNVADATALVFFIATPHFGSALANIGKVIPFTSTHVKLLANEIGFLEDLNQHYRAFARDRDELTTVVYYENQLTNSILVVPRESADPGVADETPISIDRNHINICKPTDRYDTVYMGVTRRIKKLIELTENPQAFKRNRTLVEDYEQVSDADRRDLHQKLLESGREHEFHIASNAQNSFARKYTKTGLLNNAREDHNNLLSAVETRFLLHVYHPLICQDALVSEIQDAIQDRVVDPLAGETIGSTKVDAKSVFDALYYLTGKCYVRWDKPQ